jgi:hypothetical protein
MGARRKSLDEVVWPKVKKTPQCWLWTGAIECQGYGFIHRDGKHLPAHRVVWEMLRGPIPPGHHLHHKCHNRSCVNPDCLEMLSRSEHAKTHWKNQKLYVQHLEAQLGVPPQ